jgi:hypothetical protein
VRTLIEKLISNPKKVFLTDGIGALLTGTLLIVVVIPFNKAFGMPQSALYCLAAIAYFFSIYSFYCWYIKSIQWPSLLIAISVANCVYCILTAILLINFTNTITLLGFAYFTGEIIIILSLVSLEIWTVKKANYRSNHRIRS